MSTKQSENQRTNASAALPETGPPVAGGTEKAEKCCCCAVGSKPADTLQQPPGTTKPWVLGNLDTPVGAVPQVDTRLRLADHLGTWRARWGIRRTRYRVDPGLYAIGRPTPESPVLVSSNYKMSFDRLRSRLSGLDAWVLVLDTQGINVWCAAGKGTFGTEELVRRIQQFNLLEATAHRTVIVPQLAAPGVAAHEVKKRTGVRVVFGPIRAVDIPAFLAADMKATRAMRRVRFSLRDRLALVPVEWVTLAKWPLLAAVLFFLLSGLGRDGYSLSRLLEIGLPTTVMVLTTSFGSLAIGPALLPWLPGRAFALKGLWTGLALLTLFLRVGWFSPAIYQNWLSTIAWCLLIPTAASVLVLAFTGASTYTSLSGVRRELRIALPLQLIAGVAGVVAWLVGRFM